MVECFHVITIGARHLHLRCEQYCIILPSRNKSFPRNPFEFLHIRENPVSRSSRLDPRDSRLDTRDSILERFEHRGSRIESRGSSFECQLTFERYCISMGKAWSERKATYKTQDQLHVRINLVFCIFWTLVIVVLCPWTHGPWGRRV